ncbi:ATM [Mytilus edulis]|uniref:non-specific serine/threonine protein kinase n=1 Tax=Mytilus edulis TaxID=6550 RepID=A0A8S3Q8D8_MYTED|nr:ATM [Mytilus edulis]
MIERAARDHPHHTLLCVLALAHDKMFVIIDDEELLKITLTTLLCMIERAAKDHPHHTLLCVLALAHDKMFVIIDDERAAKITLTTLKSAHDKMFMIERAAKDHPHHTLLCVLALAHDKMFVIIDDRKRSPCILESAHDKMFVIIDDRKAMIERAAKDHPHHTLLCVLALAHDKMFVIIDDRKSYDKERAMIEIAVKDHPHHTLLCVLALAHDKMFVIVDDRKEAAKDHPHHTLLCMIERAAMITLTTHYYVLALAHDKMFVIIDDRKRAAKNHPTTHYYMIERAAKDHPHHTLLCVLALAHDKMFVIIDDRKAAKSPSPHYYMIERAAKDHPHHTLLCVLALAHDKMFVIIDDKELLKTLTTHYYMIERAAKDHPHHTLLCVLALAHAKKDTEIMNPTTASTSNRRSKLSKSTSDTSKDEGRIEAAKLMLLRLKDKNSPVVRIVEDLEKLCLAYIQLANVNVERYKKETRPIQLQSVQNNLLITKIKDLHNVAVPTVDIKVDPKGSYNNLICVKGFNPTFKLAGGVNLPKIISCIGTDGKTRRQLVKGRDDLRQDAVMQQVFGMVNNLLQKNSETRKRQLHVRQYKVVPLSQMSGLLEWCEGTMPIGEYLVASSPGDEKPGAHYRYRPDDYPAIDCRRHMGGVHASPDAVKKFKVFMAVCKRFLPVFRHFFMEKFRDPAVWFEARLAYTKSVATNSIVGYILGLGDRHVQNILIDCNTAELVHIDLGVAFEQGKILPTPETVPFRLTRDIVDGMGVSGVEGVFRRCCEKTMDVMHQQPGSFVISWVENTESVNKLAERVLLRLHQKLQGIEDGVQLSVSGQVNLLIQQARDPKNLAKLFPGWQPYI